MLLNFIKKDKKLSLVKISLCLFMFGEEDGPQEQRERSNEYQTGTVRLSFGQRLWLELVQFKFYSFVCYFELEELL